MDKKAFRSRLRIIRNCNLNNPAFINKNLYRLVISQPALVAGYEKIKTNKGDPLHRLPQRGRCQAKVGNDLSGEKLEKLRQSLSFESWQPKPNIPLGCRTKVILLKPGKSSMLTYPLDVQLKIVQGALLTVLEPIYEPIFSPHSYGFRPNKNAHHALKDIESKYDGLSYAVKGDIKGMYENATIHILVDLISKKIADSRLISLIWKVLRGGYMRNHSVPSYGVCHRPTPNTALSGVNLLTPTPKGLEYVTAYPKGVGVRSGQCQTLVTVTPELNKPLAYGSTLSPLFTNIYLHELDLYMSSLVTPKVRPQKIKTPLCAKKHRNQIKRLGYKISKIKEPSERKKRVFALNQVLKYKSERTYRDFHTQVYYHRYGNDFIIGIAGSHLFCLDIKEKVRVKLEELQLQLSEDKTKIIPLRKEKARFLGYDIYIDTSKKIAKVNVKGKIPFFNGTTGWFVYLEAPIQDIIAKLCVKGFCNKNGFPTPKKIWSIMADYQIVDLYNITFADILTYYSGASHRHFLSRLLYIFRFSCAMTIATKHRSSVKKVFQQHGKSITVLYGERGENKISFKEHKVFKESNKVWILDRNFFDPYRHIF